MHTSHSKSEASGLRKLMSGKGGIAIGVTMLIAAGVILFLSFRGRNPVEDSTNRNYICAETRKTFAYTLSPGESFPVTSPYTKSATGYPAEKCYWTRDGKAKLKPTLVLLNEYVGLPGPTICPDCGREVRIHNPPPPGEAMDEAVQANRQE